MFGRLNHVAIAVPDLDASIAHYAKLGAKVADVRNLPEHGVKVAFIEVENTKVELLYPLGEKSPIRAFLDKNPPAASITSASKCPIFWPRAIV